VSSNSEEVVDESNWEELDFAHDDSTQDWARLDHTLTRAVTEVDPSGSISGKLCSIQEDAPRISDTGCVSFGEISGYQLHCRPPESEVNKQAVQTDPVVKELSGSKFNLDLPEFGSVFAPERASRPSQPLYRPGVHQANVIAGGVIGNYNESVNTAGFPISCRENTSSKTEYRHSKSAAQPVAKVNSAFLRDEFESECMPSEVRSPHPVARVDNHFLQVEFEAQSISSVGGSSCRSHTLSFSSLRRRLPLKYSRSLVDDVLYVLEHLTLSGSSAFSSRRAGRRLSKASTSSLSNKIDLEVSPPLQDADFMYPCTEPSANFLRGAYPGYCWEQIPPKALHRSQGVLHPKARISRPSGPEVSAAIRINVFSSIIDNMNRAEDLRERDAFGNSVLHIAAALSKVRELESLINLGADVNSVNNTGQTFLHLAAEKVLGEFNEISFLLRIARAHGFDFGQLDHLGQSVLHLLTRPWIPTHILDMIIATLYDLGIDATVSRDHLGWTVVEQLNHFNSRDLGFDSVRETAVLGLMCEKEGHITDQTRLGGQINRAESPKYDDLFSHNFKIPTFIETLSDLEQYTYHADLLRTVIKAMSLPWVEDSSGRNGLHCLAEVSLKLPGHIPTTQEEDHVDHHPPRERYLVDLLHAGVDPNNFDKNGNTPLMAFIIHTRVEEKDELITRVLQRLLKAGANLHWRNRNGETALHIAVKLGRREATTFLLQQNANIHARIGSGKGVLALGQEFCRKARDDVTLYAQIELCMSLAIDAGAVSAPTVLQEWTYS
jgi:ankyrin repeat protein